MSLGDLRRAIEQLDPGNHKWHFYNNLLELCASKDFLGTQLNIVYAMIVAGAREYGIYGWSPGSFEAIIGSRKRSVEIWMHLLKADLCKMWFTIYCQDCAKPVVCVTVADNGPNELARWVLEKDCPFCGGSLVDKYLYYVVDLAQIPWEINVPFHPYRNYQQGIQAQEQKDG